MIEKKLMLSTLRKQHDLLARLIDEVERKSPLNSEDILYCHEQIQLTMNNMKIIRKIQKGYCEHICNH